MKILIIPSWYPPDGGSFFREQSESIAKTGIDIDVFAQRIKGLRDIIKDPLLLTQKLQKYNENELNVYRNIYIKYPLTEKYNILPWSKKILKLFEVYISKEGLPDLVHAHSSLWAGYAAAIISEKYNIPYIVTEHRSIFVENNPIAQRNIKPFYKEIVSKSLKNASKIILVSNTLRKVLQEMEPSIHDRTVTIPNFININTYKPPVNKLPGTPFIFSSISHLEHVKGMDVLIKAFSIIKNRISFPIILKIGGTGRQLSNLKSQAKQLGVEKDIIFSGRRLTRQEVATFMQNSHAFVLASRFEAFGVVLIEAMATGLPIISTRSGGPAEIINNETGYLVDIEDPIKLAEAMESMINNYHNFDQSVIRKQAIQKYSIESTIPKIIEIYKEVSN